MRVSSRLASLAVGKRTGDIVRMATGAVRPPEDPEQDRVAEELRLAERVRAGDGDALAVLYARYRPAHRFPRAAPRRSG